MSGISATGQTEALFRGERSCFFNRWEINEIKRGSKEVQREGMLPRLRASLSGSASARVLWDLPPGVHTVAPCDRVSSTRS